MIQIRKRSARITRSKKTGTKAHNFISGAGYIELLKQKESLKEHIQRKNEGLQYARLLQKAIFQDPETLSLICPESFIVHSSKDIIGGDFYWFEKIKGKIFMACADCTGHGVPGAMLSVLGLSKLNEIITSLEFPPSSILNKLNAYIYKALGKKYSEKKMWDGMDIALYSIDTETNTLNFSGAHHPLCIVRNGELILLEGDKQSIGYSLEIKPFTNHTFQLRKSDMLYVYSDGYSDQFGGEKGKKFTRAQFKNLLASIAYKSMSEQKTALEQTLKHWMKEQEQTDDVCVVGIRIQ